MVALPLKHFISQCASTETASHYALGRLYETDDAKPSHYALGRLYETDDA